jgi:hypothetical protein
MEGCNPKPNEILEDDATVEDICDEFARVSSAEHGSRVPNFDDFGIEIDDEQEAYLGLSDLENKRVDSDGIEIDDEQEAYLGLSDLENKRVDSDASFRAAYGLWSDVESGGKGS